MNVRKMYQFGLMGGLLLCLVTAVVAALGWTNWVLALLALDIAVLFLAFHLRTQIMIQRSDAALASPRPVASQEVASGTTNEVLRAQAASESFIRGDLLELRQRVNLLLEKADADREEEAR